MSCFEFAAPTLFGLEGITGDELRRLNIENVRVENGRVLFSGDESTLARANLNLRTAERVLIVLADFPARTFEELFQGVYRTNLEDYIPADGQFPVKGHCLNSQLMSVSDCQAIIKKAASLVVAGQPQGRRSAVYSVIVNPRLMLSSSAEAQATRGF